MMISVLSAAARAARRRRAKLTSTPLQTAPYSPAPLPKDPFPHLSSVGVYLIGQGDEILVSGSKWGESMLQDPVFYPLKITTIYYDARAGTVTFTGTCNQQVRTFTANHDEEFKLRAKASLMDKVRNRLSQWLFWRKPPVDAESPTV